MYNDFFSDAKTLNSKQVDSMSSEELNETNKYLTRLYSDFSEQVSFIEGFSFYYDLSHHLLQYKDCDLMDYFNDSINIVIQEFLTLEHDSNSNSWVLLSKLFTAEDLSKGPVCNRSELWVLFLAKFFNVRTITELLYINFDELDAKINFNGTDSDKENLDGRMAFNSFKSDLLSKLSVGIENITEEEKENVLKVLFESFIPNCVKYNWHIKNGSQELAESYKIEKYKIIIFAHLIEFMSEY